MLNKLSYSLENILSQRSQNLYLNGFVIRDKPIQLVSISIAIDTTLPLILNRGQLTKITVPLLLESQGYMTTGQHENIDGSVSGITHQTGWLPENGNF